MASKERGKAVFMCGNMRINLSIDVADEFLEMFGSAGADRHVDQNNSEFGQKNDNNEIWS